MGDAGRAWFPSHFSSIMLAGYGCVGMGHAGFLGKWGGEREGKNNGKNFQKSPSPLSLHLQGRRSCTVPFKTAPCNFFFHFFLKKRKTKFGSDPKLGYDSCPPSLQCLRSKDFAQKACKENKRKENNLIILGNLPTHAHNSLFSGATSPHTHIGLFSRVTCPHMLRLVYFHGRPAQAYSKWSIFRGDRPTHSHWSIFTGDLPTHAHTGLFSWATCPSRKTKSGLIVMGDLPR